MKHTPVQDVLPAPCLEGADLAPLSVAGAPWLTMQRFWRKPRSIGAIAPSSSALADALARAFEPTTGTLIELGPGTGSITQALRRRHPDASIVTLERDVQLVRHMRARHPDVLTIHGDAVCAVEHLGRRGVVSSEAVVSSLPWSLLDAREQHGVLDSARTVLTPNGVFVTFLYLTALFLPRGAAFRRAMNAHFSCVETREIVLGNLPPAVVLRGTNAHEQ